MRRSPEESCLRGKDVSRLNGDMPGQYRTFRERFCERFTCQPTAYETTALWELLDPQPRLFGRVLAWLKPDLLETDRKILRRVSHLDTVPDVLLAVQDIEKEYEAGDENKINDLLKQIEADDIEVMEDTEEEISVTALQAAVEPSTAGAAKASGAATSVRRKLRRLSSWFLGSCMVRPGRRGDRLARRATCPSHHPDELLPQDVKHPYRPLPHH